MLKFYMLTFLLVFHSSLLTMLLSTCITCILTLPLLTVATSLQNISFPQNESSIPHADISPSDISASVDDFVEVWKQNNPQLGPAELKAILVSAETAKAAILNPSSHFTSNKTARKVSDNSPKYPIQPLRSRQQQNSTLSTGNFTLEEARLVVYQYQQAANAHTRERFENPRLNNYYAHSNKTASLKARAHDAAAITPSDHVKAAAALVAEADAEHAPAAFYSSFPSEVEQLKS